MTNLRNLGIVGLVLVLCSCAMPKKIDVSQLPPVPRLGVLVLTDDHPIHVNVGTTMFGNFIVEGKETWDLSKPTLSKISRLLGGRDEFEIIPIAPPKDLFAMRNKLEDFFTGGPSASAQRQFKIIAQTHRLDLLFVLSPYMNDVDVQVPVQAAGFGLYTRCFMGACWGKPLLHIQAALYSTTPIELAGRARPGYANETLKIDFHNYDVENLPDEIIGKSKDPLLQALDRVVTQAFARAGLKQGLDDGYPSASLNREVFRRY